MDESKVVKAELFFALSDRLLKIQQISQLIRELQAHNKGDRHQ
ncbi:hypothetical protein ACE1AT_02080 [Pelatocladus sp. BLCC-F211]